MIKAKRLVKGLATIACVLVAVVVLASMRRSTVKAADFLYHPIVGSWFGKAVQLCVSAAPSACVGGNPAITLLMTPSLYGDGNFLGNDSLTLGGAPFGPHTTAHGSWTPTSSTAFVTDYAFMLPTFPPPPGGPTIQGLRFRWSGNVINPNTTVGFVNIYFSTPIPLTWQGLLGNEFPTFPAEANSIVTTPVGVVTDPTTCTQPGCPLVFKFTIKRVAPVS